MTAMHRKLLHTGKTRGKKKTYLAITAVMLLMLATAAVLLLHQATERRAEEYTRKARESYSAGDYENALLYLRRIKDEDRNTEILLLTADCYEALENYPRALETLRKLNTADPAISNRIQSIDVNLFLDYCRKYKVETEKTLYIYENSNKTLARKKSSLSVLFKYLYRDKLVDENMSAFAALPVQRCSVENGVGDEQGFIGQKFHHILPPVSRKGRSAHRLQWPSR